MSVIFNHALNAIKTNPDSSLKEWSSSTRKRSTQRDNEEDDGNNEHNAKGNGSILTRIKVNKNSNKFVVNRDKNTNTRSNDSNAFRIQKKTIKKDGGSLASRIIPRSGRNNRRTSDDDIIGGGGSGIDADTWKHDLYNEGPSPSFDAYAIFIRNLPDNIDEHFLKGLTKNPEHVIGAKIERDTAEINFSRRDAASRAVEAMNGRIVMGRKLKAALVSETNRQTFRGTSPEQSHGTLRSEGRDIGLGRSMQIDEEQSAGARSIFSRIQKAHKQQKKRD